MLILSVIGILYAAFLAIGQRDMKRLVAYTSVAHFGFIGIGIFAFTTQGGTGAVLYMVNHALLDRRAVPGRRHPDRARARAASSPTTAARRR